MLQWNYRDLLNLVGYLLKWFSLCVPLAGAVGTACALFLWLLELATAAQWSEPRLLFLLPFAGMLIAGIYHWLGKVAEAGSNLIVDEIHEPGGGVPARMAPLILISTIITHLFGGSAGREGTAVQMGGSMAAEVSRWLKLSRVDNRTLLMTGIAAGFGGVFGTPVAGAVFALEVIAMGRITHEAIVPCLIASIVGDWSCSAWGIHHTNYHQVIATHSMNSWILLGKVALAAVAFGLASQFFAELTHEVQKQFKRWVKNPLFRPALGGVLVIALVYALGTRDFLGLGVYTKPGEPGGVSIVSSFHADGAHPFSWWWKILFTAITLGSGFKGGEVTPLFFIGATLGNSLSMLLGAPTDLFAALGFVAVFAGATNTPIACTIMGIELFGGEHTVYIAAACFLAYLFSGHSGIYLSQRIATPKIHSTRIFPEMSLRDERNSRRQRVAQDNVPDKHDEKIVE